MNEDFITINDFENKNNKEEYEVWDEKKQKWCTFKDSCYYANMQFPKQDEAKFPINLISVHYSKEDQFYTFGIRPYTGDSPLVKNYHYCIDENTMIKEFIHHFRKKNVDILTGWNVMGFDVPYIINRCKNLKIEESLSPINIYKERRTGGYHIEGGGYVIAGISILDGLELYKNFVYTKRERYSLQFIGQIELKKGKKDLEGTVNNEWKNNWNNFVEYNVNDVILCKEIEDKKKHIKLTIDFCYQALIPFDKIFSTISLVTGYMLRYLHERNIVFPDREHTGEKDKKFPGAYVMAKPGYYNWVVSFDVASMYPHLLMMYNISPETLVLNPENPEDYYSCPISKQKTWETIEGNFECGGVYYRKDKKGVMAEIVSDIYQERKVFKKKGFIAEAITQGRSLDDYSAKLIEAVRTEGDSAEYYDSQQKIRKILINSIYGCLGNEYFNFYNINNAIAVTLGGQDLIRYLSNSMNDYMKQNWHKIGPKLYPEFTGEWKTLTKDVVILVDTDSVDGNTLIETSIGKIKISELFNMCENFEEYSNSKFIGKFKNKEILTQSLNLQNEEIENNKIKYVMKHKVKKQMYKIKYGEKEIILTEDHSLMIRRNKEILEISPKNLQKGDKIIIKSYKYS